MISARARLANLQAAILTLVTGEHAYLSTSCAHGDHEHCRSTVNVAGGEKTPGTCKFCTAVCRCSECDHGASTADQL